MAHCLAHFVGFPFINFPSGWGVDQQLHQGPGQSRSTNQWERDRFPGVETWNWKVELELTRPSRPIWLHPQSFKHGTSKWWFPIGISFSSGWFSGSMLNFRGVNFWWCRIFFGENLLWWFYIYFLSFFTPILGEMILYGLLHHLQDSSVNFLLKMVRNGLCKGVLQDLGEVWWDSVPRFFFGSIYGTNCQVLGVSPLHKAPGWAPKLWQFTKKHANNNCFMFHSNCIFLLVK